MSYIQKLQKRTEQDNRAVANAISDLASIVSDDNEGGYWGGEWYSTDRAVREILSFMGIKNIIEAPDELENSEEGMDYMMRAAGIMGRKVSLHGQWWKHSAGPLLAKTKAGDTVALIPAATSGYTYYDIISRRRVKVNRKTAKNIDTSAFCFYPPLPYDNTTLKDLGAFIIHNLTWSDVGLILIVSLVVSMLGLLLPYVNKQIFDLVIPSGMRSNVYSIAVLLLGVTASTAMFTIARSSLIARLRDKVRVWTVSAVMSKFLSLPASFFKEYSSGELGARMMGIRALFTLFSDEIVSAVLALLFSFVYLFQMSRYAPRIFVPAMFILSTMFAFGLLTGFLQQRLFSRQKRVSVKLDGLVYQLFSGIQKIKIAGAEKRAFAKWAAAYKELGKLTYSPSALIRLKKAISDALVLSGMIILYYYAGTGLAKYHDISVSDYIAFSIAYGAVSRAVMSVSNIMASLSNIGPLIEMVKPVLEANSETDQMKRQVTSLDGHIELSNVTFRYDDKGPAVIDNISFTIQPGEHVAIVGTSSSGKSTLMKILLGFEKPESGAVYFDGKDLNKLDLRSLRQRIGTCLQDGKLFAGEIFTNIILSSPWSTIEDAWEAARLAGVDSDIREMPMGMRTVVSERGGGISGGQRQRILIARALVSKPDILFFDEATSALDNITQKAISERIESLNCTRVVIAHRLSTVINCDRILVLDKGRIVEEGKYSELIEKKGLFFELIKRQMGT